MKKYILIPDSFKGTLSSIEICSIMEEQIKRLDVGAQILSIPVADGGEGSVDCFVTACGGEKVFKRCQGPYMEDVNAFYGLVDDGKTAVIEMAAAAGLPMVEDRKNPLQTTTYGVGQMMLDAAKRGAKRIILGLGGSCTNDFGCGAAYACGVRFGDKNNNPFMPVGATLKNIEYIDVSRRSKLLDGVEIIVMCDIDNPPFGENGAARVFAPQKGANEREVELLDEGVRHTCEVVFNRLGIDVFELKGGGAAGAMGAGMAAFFGAKLKMGIDTVLDVVQFSSLVQDADVVFTGEGKIDSQSLRGKVVIGVARAAKAANVPVIVVVGGSEGDMQEAYEQGVSAVFSINRLPQDLSISKEFSRENLAFAMENIVRLMLAKK